MKNSKFCSKTWVGVNFPKEIPLNEISENPKIFLKNPLRRIRYFCTFFSQNRLRRQQNIKEISFKIKSKIYEKLKIWKFNVIFQKKSLEKLFLQTFKFCQKIPYGESILLVPFWIKSCRNGDFDFFSSGPQKFANF